MMRNVIQISPTYPPNTGGVGYYAVSLAKCLIAKGIKSKFLMPDHSEQRANNQELFGSKTSELSILLEKHNAKEIILHFSGYGYATRGLCFDLIKQIKKWKDKHKERRLVTIFHEVYAEEAPIYKSAFWTELPQKYIAKNLLKLSDCAVTTSKYAQSQLFALNPEKKITVSNSFSNVGTVKRSKKLNKRKKTAIIFGGTSQKNILYKDMFLNKKNYLSALDALSVEQIIDIGPKVKGLKKIGHIPIKAIGIKSNAFISKLLSSAQAGLIFYAIHVMTKSSIAASYATHGVVIINFCKIKILKTNEFALGVNFVSNVDEKKKLNYQKIVNRAKKLYKNNSPTKLALLISRFIK